MLAGWDTNQMLGGLGPILNLAEAGALDLITRSVVEKSAA